MNLGLTYTKDADGSKVMSMPDETREWVISFVRENARKSPAEIEAIIQVGHRELLAALEGVSEAQAAYKPGADDWSILELVAHVVSVKQVLAALAGSLRKGGAAARIRAAVRRSEDAGWVHRPAVRDGCARAGGVAGGPREHR